MSETVKISANFADNGFARSSITFSMLSRKLIFKAKRQSIGFKNISMYFAESKFITMNEIEKTRIEGLLTQWTRLSEYFEKLDTDHWQVFTIVFAALGLSSLINNTGLENILYWIILPTITLLLYYEAYRLREITILKGYLAKIERNINRLLEKGDSINFLWFYSYNIIFFTNNNLANEHMSVPIIFAFIIVELLMFIQALITVLNNGWSIVAVFYFIEFVITLVFDILAFVSILQNGKMQYIALHFGEDCDENDSAKNISSLSDSYFNKYKNDYKKFQDKIGKLFGQDMQ